MYGSIKARLISYFSSQTSLVTVITSIIITCCLNLNMTRSLICTKKLNYKCIFLCMVASVGVFCFWKKMKLEKEICT